MLIDRKESEALAGFPLEPDGNTWRAGPGLLIRHHGAYADGDGDFSLILEHSDSKEEELVSHAGLVIVLEALEHHVRREAEVWRTKVTQWEKFTPEEAHDLALLEQRLRNAQEAEKKAWQERLADQQKLERDRRYRDEIAQRARNARRLLALALRGGMTDNDDDVALIVELATTYGNEKSSLDFYNRQILELEQKLSGGA